MGAGPDQPLPQNSDKGDNIDVTTGFWPFAALSPPRGSTTRQRTAAVPRGLDRVGEGGTHPVPLELA